MRDTYCLYGKEQDGTIKMIETIVVYVIVLLILSVNAVRYGLNNEK